MPHAYAAQFRAMVVEQVRSGRRVAEVAAASSQCSDRGRSPSARGPRRRRQGR